MAYCNPELLMRLQATEPACDAGRRDQAKFRCLLDEQPTVLLPEPAAAELRAVTTLGDAPLNPWCLLSPKELGRPPFLERFEQPKETIWILDPPSNSLLPFGLGAEFRRYLECMQLGECSGVAIPPRVSAILRYARVLVPDDYNVRRESEWNKTTTKRASFFRRHGYVRVNRLFHAFHIASLRHYYRDLINRGEFERDRKQCPKRLFMHNEPTTRFFHHQLTAVVSAIVGEPVQPSFSFVSCYESGACLEKHIDREQCEYTISLCVDFVPEPRTVTRWPLWIDAALGPVAIQQELGDALLFRGRDLPHYRDTLTEGASSTSVFFHFVRRNFTGDLD